MSVDLRRNPRNWEIPEYFNIGSACTDGLLDSPVADQVALIVEDDALGTINRPQQHVKRYAETTEQEEKR